MTAPTDLPPNTTVMLRCCCVYGHNRTVRYPYARCPRHGYTEHVSAAVRALRYGPAEAALRVLRTAS